MSKRLIFLFLSIWLVFLLPINAYAHPGNTDSSGGHYNHSTGKYHYHHGYPEHQHTNGKCPYADGGSSDDSGFKNFLIIVFALVVVLGLNFGIPLYVESSHKKRKEEQEKVNCNKEATSKLNTSQPNQSNTNGENTDELRSTKPKK